MCPTTCDNMLEQSGFEVGVHGLEHDGKLYSSKATFAAKASRIREYLQRWNACGFRSPLMQHKLKLAARAGCGIRHFYI